MKISPNTKRRWLAGTLAVITAAGLAGAAEMRTWTNLKGQAIQAQLLAVDGENVRLRMNTGRDVTIERKTLSAADQKYLTEYGGATELPIDPKAKVGMPAKTMKFDSKTIVKLDEMLEFPEGHSIAFDLVETDHFLIATSGSVRGKDTAELAERLWAGFSFQHPGFKDKWGDRKKVIILCGEESDYTMLGEYEIQRVQQSGAEDAANIAANRAATWPRVSANSCGLSGDMQEKHNAHPSAVIFKAYDKRTWQRGVWNSFPTNVLSGRILREMMGGAGGGAGAEGAFAVSTGHAYFKEIQLTGKTVTSLVNADLYESDEIVTAGGFEDGTKWARTLRSLVKKGKVTPDLAALWRLSDAGDLTPETMVLSYGLARYMQSTPTRLAKFSVWMNRVDTSQQVPVPIETAKIFGFETVKEMEDDWTEYLQSTAFK